MRGYRLKDIFYTSLPFLGALLFALIESISFSFIGYNQSYISGLLGIIFYFAAFNPSSFNIVFVFVLGIFSDYLIQAPIGMQAFLFTIVFFLACFNRRFILMSSFKTQWVIFTFVSGIAFLIGLVLLKMAYGFISSIDILLKEYLATVFSYPFIAWICGFVNQKLGQIK